MIRLLLSCAAALAAVGIVAAQAPTAERPDPRSLRLRGDRFKPLTYDDMTPAQKTMIEHLLSGPRAGADGPFNALLRSPEMGDLAQQFGASVRFKIGVMGWYQTVSMLLNTDRYPLPEGTQPELKPLK